MEQVKGYKVFDPEWKCRGFQFEVGKIFEEDIEPSCCNRGFHFCKELNDCFSYYSFDPKNKVAEVIALGDIDEQADDSKCCTNKIQIVRELTWEEVLGMLNTGKDNTGSRNTGDWNTGDWNTGNWNTGNRNTGNRNTGNCNTGDWNKGNYSTGVFNTKEETIRMFDKPSDWTYKDWLNSNARYILNQIPKQATKWILSADMTDEEKKAHPEHETTGGYLKVLDESGNSQKWWDELTDKQKKVITDLPNFDAAIFEEITGVKM